MVENVAPKQVWEALVSNPLARLVDVRTDIEWAQIGVPDLATTGGEPVLLSWQVAPTMQVNPHFVADLRAAGIEPEHEVYFLCRSGVRSLAAAQAAQAAGYSHAYNIADGFEGPPGPGGLRGAVAGWQADELPWRGHPPAVQPVTAAPRYDRTTIALHWATAALIGTQWCVAKVIDDFPRGDPRVMVRSVHLTIGVILVLLIAARVVWRATRGRRLPAADRGALHVLAKATHWGLYALILATLAGGLTLWWLRGDSWFLLFRPTTPDPANHDLSETVGYVHGLFGTCILILAAIHASAALVHRYVWHDGVLSRMLTGPRRAT